MTACSTSRLGPESAVLAVEYQRPYLCQLNTHSMVPPIALITGNPEVILDSVIAI